MTLSFFGREPALGKEEFVGRKAILNWIEDRLSSVTPQNINLVGEPRIGKTSTLYQVYQQRLGLHSSDKGLYVWMPVTALATYNSLTFWQQILARLEAVYRSEDTGIDVELALDAGGIFEQFKERLQQLIEVEGYQTIIFLIDDFDVIVPGLNTHDLDWLRSIVTDLRKSVAFVIASTDPLRELTDDLQKSSISPFHNVFSHRRLKLLNHEQAEKLIQIAADARGKLPLSKQHKAFLIQEAGRHPDLLRIITEHFSYAWEEAGDQFSDNLLQDAVRVDFRYDSNVLWLYEHLLARRTPAQKRALLDLAQGLPSEDTLLLSHLELHLGLVERKDGNSVPFSDSFRAWLLQQVAATSTPAPAVEEQTTAFSSASTAPTLYFDSIKRQVLIGDRVPMRLTKLEYRIVKYMIAREGEVCTHEELLQDIWGGNRNKAVVEKAMNRLRSRLEPDVAIPQYIVSVRGQGYALQNSKMIDNQHQ